MYSKADLILMAIGAGAGILIILTVLKMTFSKHYRKR